MNNVLFRRGNQTFIDKNVPLNDGQIIFNETDEAIYVDTLINGSVVRKRYGGGNLSRSDIDMALSTVSENPVANKVLTELMVQKDEIIDDFGTAMAVTKNEVPVGCKVAQTLNNDNIATRQIIAPIETTLTASQPYSIGDQFIYNGLLYKATATIARGGTITINGNCTLADSVTKQISGKCNYLHLPALSATTTHDYIVNLARQFLNYDNGAYVFVGGWIGQYDCVGYVQIASAGGNNKYIAFTMNMSSKLYICTYVSGEGSFYIYEMNGTAI